MIKLKGNALWTNKRKSFFIQYIVNLPNSLPQGVIETNAVAGFQSGLDNFMAVIKIRSPASSDNDKGNQTPCCSLRDDGWRHGEGALPPCVPPEELDGALRGTSPSFEEAGAAHRWGTGSVTGLLRCDNPLLLSKNKTREPGVNF